MTAATIRQNIKKHLLKQYSQNDLARWFDPLDFSLNPEQQTITVLFPHQLFAEWFIQQVKDKFEEQCAAFVRPYTIVYQCSCTIASCYTKQKQPQIEQKEYTSASTRFPIEEHTFDSFLFNKKNDFPVAAAKEFVNSITQPTYCLLTIYGQSGSGKTHLLEAMMNELQRRYHYFPFFYGDIQDFLEYWPEYSKKNPQTKRESCFFIDDCQHIKDDGHKQGQLGGIIDAMRRTQTPLAVNIDMHPSEHKLLPSLQHRLTSGLVVKLKRPDIDIRRQYIQHMNTEFSLDLSKEQTLMLAQRYTDFRSITGSLTKVKAYKLLMHKESTPDLSGIIGPQESSKGPTPQSITAAAAEYFSVSQEDIRSKSRHKETTKARQLCIYLCRELLGLSLAQIGHFYGGRDHSSVVYAIKKVKELQQSNKYTNKILTDLKKLCTK